ncbi:MAG: outer membrane lipoprotein carrier protein LolA [Firmicutes bacterium]|nr:outer membrane lipoprotein carrier protein LolA [Bacillota bacterium]
MSKKVLIWSLLCLFFVTLLFAGCGGGNNISAPESDEEVESTPAEQSTASGEESSVAEIFAKAKDIENLYFEYVLTSGEDEAEGKTWIKGKQFKSEICVEEQIIVSIIDFDEATAYTYVPSQNIAMKIDIDMINIEEFKNPTEYTKDIDPHLFRVVETTTYEGHQCKVIVFTDEEVQEETKMWVSEKYGIPLRVETTIEGSTTVLEYKNLQVGSVDDEAFTIPQGVEIIEMDMGSAIPELGDFMTE